MNYYLAGNTLWNSLSETGSGGGIFSRAASEINVLMSFWRREELITSLIPKFKNFMLDSGAFTFLKSGRCVNWDEYISRYIEYINANDVRLFFELDIDKIIGGDVIIYAEGEHSCMTARGIKKFGTVTKTLDYRGAFNQRDRREEFFLSLNLQRN